MREQYLEKPLPSSEESERVILGSILLENSVINQVIGKLVPEDFYSPANKHIYEAMLELISASKPIDPILIGEEMKRAGTLSPTTGVSTITNLTFGIHYSPNIDKYIDIVKKKSLARQTVKLCAYTTSAVLEEDVDIDDVLEEHEQKLYTLNSVTEKQDFSPVGTLAEQSLTSLKEKVMNNEVVTLGIPSGFKDLDEMTAGYQKTDLIVKAGRPSMGKTAQALQECLNATQWDPSLVVAVFSLEMSKSQCINRLICQEARVNASRYRIGHLMTNEWERVAQAVNAIHGRHIYIDDQPRQTVMEIKAKARKLRSEKKRLDLIIVDHLGLVKGGGRSEKRLELGEITKSLKALAKEMEIPVVLLCQLSRGPEKRTDNRPIMSDLAESGEIEQDADVVELIFREDYYKETEENKGIAETILAKNRNGPTGTVKLAFLKESMRFEDLYG